METISLKSNARPRKTLTKHKGLYLQRLIGTLSRMSVFTEFFINMIFFIYIPAILWDFSYFII